MLTCDTKIFALCAHSHVSIHWPPWLWSFYLAPSRPRSVGPVINHCPWVHIYILSLDHFYFHTRGWPMFCPWAGFSLTAVFQSICSLYHILSQPIHEPKEAFPSHSLVIRSLSTQDRGTDVPVVDDMQVWDTCSVACLCPPVLLTLNFTCISSVLGWIVTALPNLINWVSEPSFY